MSIKNTAILALTLTLLFTSATAAELKGTIYAWDTLEPLPNTIIEIDTTPKQTFVAKDGIYSFYLPPGDYSLLAVYSENGAVLYIGEENIEIKDDKKYTLDIITFTPLDDDLDLSDLMEEDFNSDIGLLAKGPPQDPNIPYYIMLFVLIAIIAAVAYYWQTNKSVPANTSSIPQTQNQKQTPLLRPAYTPPAPETLDQPAINILKTLERYGGRLTQKELREKIGLGEAQTSLIISELESMGYVKKIKKGRGNIIVLRRQFRG